MNYSKERSNHGRQKNIELPLISNVCVRSSSFDFFFIICLITSVWEGY